ncbi:MAG: energy transducer TonB [Candidatus Azobacteroides sp.]|nr:energy transducer TonB [Candidatus Azobacteroides sp.]
MTKILKRKWCLFSFTLFILGGTFSHAQQGYQPEDEIKEPDNVISRTIKSESKEQAMPFEEVTSTPEFPGGKDSLLKYLSHNLIYPAIAVENKIQGKVVVSFVVKKDGTIDDIKIVRGIDPSCDKEALRIVKRMPAWIPGKENGEAVNVHYTLPIVFKMD